MNDSPRCRSAAAALVLLLGAPVAVAAAPTLRDFVPDIEGASFPRLSGTMWVAESTDYVLRAQRIGEDDRRTYIRRVTGSETDPYSTPSPEAPAYLTFLVEVENKSDGDLVLQPKNCWLVTNKHQIEHPVGIDDLSAELALMEREITPAYEATRPAILADSRLLAPGESASGLFIYRTPRPKTKRFQVDFVLMSARGDLIKHRAAYRRPTKKELKDEP